MLPYILAAVGGYLIGDSLKGKQYAEGGKIYEVAIDEGKLGTRTLADFESKIEAESFLREYKAKNPDSKLFIDSITSDFSTNFAEGGKVKYKIIQDTSDFDDPSGAYLVVDITNDKILAEFDFKKEAEEFIKNKKAHEKA